MFLAQVSFTDGLSWPSISFALFAVIMLAALLIAARRYRSRRELARQREQAWLSTAQLQVAEAIGLSRNREEMLTAVTRLTPMLVGTQFCFIFLWDEERQEYGEAAVYGLPAKAAEALADVRLSIGDWHALDAVHVGQEPQLTCHSEESRNLSRIWVKDSSIPRNDNVRICNEVAI